MELYNIKKYYQNFEYPKEFKKILELNLINFDFWYIFPLDELDVRICGMKERYPNRQLIPFARRGDCDDVACFEIGRGEKVEIIHDFASEGYEQRKEYNSFWNWFRDAIEEMIEEGEYEN